MLHPLQVDVANEVFMPTQEQFDAARRLLDAYHHATHVERKGAVMHEGQMIDEASRKIAEAVVARGEAAGMASTGAGVTLALDQLTDEQREIVDLVRQFADERIIPVASELEHADAFPDDIVEGLKELGIFGFTIPEEYGGLGLDLTTYALAVEELSRGWMSVLGDRQHALHRRRHADARRHRGAARALPAAHGDRRDALRLLDDRAGVRLRRPGDPHDGASSTAPTTS